MSDLKYEVMKGNVAHSVGMVNKLKQTFPQTVMLQLYYAIIHPLLLYIYGIIISNMGLGCHIFYYIQKFKS